MKKFELIKAGQPSEVEILSEYSMNDIIGGGDYYEKCNKGYNRTKGKCKCGFLLEESDLVAIIETRP